MSNIAANLERLRQDVAAEASRCRRDPAGVQILAVCKTFPAEAVVRAALAGQMRFGENRVQEAEGKIPGVTTPGLEWHLVGHLQSNKARRAVQLFDVIESVDSDKLARTLDRDAAELGKRVPVYLQVNIGEEPQKHGVRPEDTIQLAALVRSLTALRPVGLMSIPPNAEDPEESRPYFAALHRLLDRVNRELDLELPGLSMGMSHDWRVAVQEGATLIRIGTAIFGSRTP